MRWHPLIVEQANALGKVVDGGICGTRLRGRKGAGGGIGGGRMSDWDEPCLMIRLGLRLVFWARGGGCIGWSIKR